MDRVNFLFGIHNHQPIGNFDFVFEDAYEKSYLPFLQVLHNFPAIKMALHFSGILLDWLKEKHPELIDLVKTMVQRGQLEMITGGYYEPILTIIPEEDRIGQIRKLSKEIKRLFDYDPKGMWLAERVWEPTLPTTLAKSEIVYTITDDTHFKHAGLNEDQLTGYYMTEDLGNSTILFPISKRLRYTIPFEDPQITIDYLRSKATEDCNNIIVFADDGEKFGVWPNTFDHVYTDKWLERFFQALQDNSEWINMIHFSEVINLVKPLGKIYLPTASYSEMMHWSLFPGSFQAYEDFEDYLKIQKVFDDVHVFVRGGFWRNFFAKYSEVNDMHKKMLRVSNKLWSLPENAKKKAKAGFDNLWQGQCNCPYWHGVFGGLYLSHLRDAIYSSLIRAEIVADKAAFKSFPALEVSDIDVDGYDEIIAETEQYNAYFNLGAGGMIYELDHKPTTKNLLDTMTRRIEGYHKKLKEAVVPGDEQHNDTTASIHDLVLAKEPDLVSKLFYDQYKRKSFIDHFINETTTLESFAASRFGEDGDFYNNEYEIRNKKVSKDNITLHLQRLGNVWHQGKNEPVLLEKKFKLMNSETRIEAEYILTNRADIPLNLWFGVELNFGLQAGHADDRYYYINNGKMENKYLDSLAERRDADFIGLRDEWRNLDIQIHTEDPTTLWRFPIETISLSEAGFERVYQSSVVFPNWNINLKKTWKTKIILLVNKIDE